MGLLEESILLKGETVSVRMVRLLTAGRICFGIGKAVDAFLVMTERLRLTS